VAAPFSATDVLDLFNPNVYGGAPALYALRQVVGDRTFYEIARRWVLAELRQDLLRPRREERVLGGADLPHASP
jgi:hypothetical protein